MVSAEWSRNSQRIHSLIHLMSAPAQAGRGDAASACAAQEGRAPLPKLRLPPVPSSQPHLWFFGCFFCLGICLPNHILLVLAQRIMKCQLAGRAVGLATADLREGQWVCKAGFYTK